MGVFQLNGLISMRKQTAYTVDYKPGIFISEDANGYRQRLNFHEINLVEMWVSCDQKDFPDDSWPLAKPVGFSKWLQLPLLLSCFTPRETYLDVLFEALSKISGFINYDSGVRCGPKPIIQISQ